MRLYLIILVTLAISAMSCSTARLPYVKGVDDVKVSKFTKDSLHMNIALRINNPGTWGFRVKNVNLALTLNGKPVGTIKGKMPFKRIGKGERAYDVQLATGTGAIIGALPDFLSVLSGKNMDLRMQGEMRVRWFIFGKKIKFDSKKDLKLPKMGFGKN